MDKTKANIRAIRESCGMTQSDVSGETGATVGVVRSWEDTSCGVLPSDDVWAWLLMAHDAMVMDARDAVEQIMSSRTTQVVALPYYRTQHDLDAVQLAQGIDEPVGYHNARTRMVAQMLAEREVPYEFVYPQAE